MDRSIRFARRVFKGAAIWGVLVLLPMVGAEWIYDRFGSLSETHPENLYGFVGGALVAQLFYWTIGTDPVRYRAFMPLAVLAKLAFFVPSALLFAGGRIEPMPFGFSCVDLLLGTLFVLAWRRTPAA